MNSILLYTEAIAECMVLAVVDDQSRTFANLNQRHNISSHRDRTRTDLYSISNFYVHLFGKKFLRLENLVDVFAVFMLRREL